MVPHNYASLRPSFFIVTYPRSVRIGPFSYKIRWSTRALKALEPEHGPLYGFCDTDKQVIYCAKSGVLHRDQSVDTLLHEILHAALHVGRVTLSEKREEQVVLALAPTLLSIIRDNPHLIEFLTQEEN